MSEFFANYPRINYDITGDNSTNPDFTVFLDILKTFLCCL